MTAEGASSPAVAERRSGVRGGLRRHAARGTVINAAFLVATSGLTFLQRIIVAALLTPSEFGLWGVVLTALLLIIFLKNAGIGDKFVQQDEADQERAFQKAFTIDLLLGLACVAASLVAFPVFGVVYGEWEIVVPGLVLSLAIVGNSLQAPVWIHYRRMDFVRQRLLQAIDPVVNFVVTISLAIAGLGVWSLVIGAVVGAWTSGLILIRISPYPVRLAYERSAVRDYFAFSWPLVVANGSAMGIGQAAQLITTRITGLAGAGGLNLGYTVSVFTRSVDAVVTQTIYPVICSVRDRRDLLFESFVKSNRLAMLWGLPFGFGVALFAADLVHLVVGDKWAFAIGVVQSMGVVAAMEQVGFNWTAYCRALDWTRPLAVLGVVNLVAFVAISLPLTLAEGLDGFAIGNLLWGGVTLAGRAYYLRQLFPAFNIARHALRALVPAAPPVAVILLLRLLLDADRTAGVALAELAVFVAVTIGSTLLFERTLLREMAGYLRRRQARAGGDAT